MNKNKEDYLELCQTQNDICVFMQPFWMDAVCGEENWDVLLHRDGDGKIDAAWPYYFIRKGKKIVITHPQQTQIQGIWMRHDPSWSEEKRLSFEKDVCFDLIDRLEAKGLYSFYQQFPVEFTNWLPFYWKKFTQQTRYTYRILDITDPDEVLATFNRAKRKNINKAMKEGITVKFDLLAQDFYENHVMTLRQQGATIGYSFDVFRRMYDAAYANNAGRTIYAVDREGNLHGALFNIWGGNVAYDLISTIDHRFRNSGAATLLVYEMIKYLSDKVKVYDFEGSMMEGVENSFRQFGTTQTPYMAISKDNSSPIKKALLELWHGRKRLFG